jgi:hypothetical protein
MKSFLFCSFLFIFFATYTAKCQISPGDTSQKLEELFNRLVDNYNDNERIRINDSIRMILDGYVKSDSVFAHRFRNLRYLGQITSPDSLIKIVTWNLVLEKEPGRYYCYLIRKQENGGENKIYSLSATYNDKPVNTDNTYTHSDWYGALYYDLKSYIVDNIRCWVILGIDYGNPNISRKLVDVLNFKPDGSIVFGRKWFADGEEKKYRVVFEYAANAMMSLRFKSENSIIFDHLVPFKPAQKDDHQFYGPDYSVDAYNFDNGIWKLKINVDVRNKE